MSKSLNSNHHDTAVSGVTTLSLDRAILNFGADFRVKSQDPAQAVIVNMTSPVDCPETFKFAVSPVKDIYKGSSVDPSLFDASRRGVSILCALNDVVTITDSSDATYRVDKPLSAHIVIKVPYDTQITGGMIESLVGRLVSGLYETGDDGITRIAALMRGSLLPVDL